MFLFVENKANYLLIKIKVVKKHKPWIQILTIMTTHERV